MNKCGVYKIINIIDKKVYIGGSINLKTRKRKHFEKLRANTHENRYLKEAFNKHGEENFVFEIIEYVKNKENLLIREQYWIDLTKCYDRDFGYNILSKAGSTLGYKHTQEAIEKLRKISLKNGNKPPNRKGIKLSEEHKAKISKSHTGKKMSQEAITKSANSRRGRPLPECVKNKISQALKGRIVVNKIRVVNLTTKEVFNSLTEASIKYGVSYVAISNCCNGKSKTSAGCKWYYYDKEVNY